MGKQDGNLLAPMGDLFDTGMSNITGLANTFNRALVGRGFQDAILPDLTRTTGHATDVGRWTEDFAGDTYDARRAAMEENMAGYGAARTGQGPRSTLAREGVEQSRSDYQGAIDYADKAIDPLLANSKEAYDLAKGQYVDTRAKMDASGREAVSTAREGLSRTMDAGKEVMAGIVDQVATGIAGASARMSDATEQAEVAAQQAEANGRPDVAASLRQRARMQSAQELGNESQKFRVIQSQMETDARQKNMALTSQATDTLIATISKTATDEAGADAGAIRNVIDAVATGNQAAGLAIQGPLAARIQAAASGERDTRLLMDAVGMDEEDITNHAINIDNMIGSNAQSYINNTLSGVQTQMQALSQLIQGHGAIAQILSGVQFTYTPGVSQAVSDYMQLQAADAQPPGPSGYDRAMGAAVPAAMITSMWGA